MAPTFVQLALSAFLAAAFVKAESHTISFTNNCGKGTPQLIDNGVVVSNGTAFTKDGVINGIAYLQTGECSFNGESCALLEFNMANPVVAGGGSSVDISLITPHELNVPVGFNYYNGCDGTGSQCLTGNCHTAFFQPDDNQVQVACQTDNVDLMITFCPDGSSSDDSSSSVSAAASSASSTKKAATTSSAAATTSTAAAATTSATAVESAATSPVKHVAAATSVESTASSTANASSASSAPTTRASSKTCKAKAAASKRSNQSAAKRANSWHHRSRNARAAF